MDPVSELSTTEAARPALGVARRGSAARPLHPGALAQPRRLVLAAVVLVGLAYATMIQSFTWNQSSHYALIRSLDNDRTTIDAYRQNTGDKVFYRGHWYSTRAPGLALFALPFYDTLNLVHARSWARSAQALPNGDEMGYLIGLWANVLPGRLL